MVQMLNRLGTASKAAKDAGSQQQARRGLPKFDHQ
ncbi:hypothetical protein HaLaN_20582 [Haematococcus lacustris]|uniref:Uncharacterized protein n=1 Tax=Haematococcus lacustris TaxID=44745 RepID=A0A699ZWI2_HAELA|nr:hypothetical protein HaLaN_20582 [Haematococcus lacustris]